MPIFNTTIAPQAPEFVVAPQETRTTLGNSDTEHSASNQSSSSRSSMRVFNRVNSILFRKQSSLTKLRRSASSRMKRSASSFSLASSQSKQSQFRIAQQHRSLFFFKSKNPLRRLLLRVTVTQLFDYVILVFILANCVTLAMTNRSNSEQLTSVLTILEWIFTGVFCVELIMKVIALGLILHPGSYLRNPWNVLDGAIVAMSFLQVLPGINNYSGLRSLRALRPLRSVQVLPGLKLIVNSLFQSVPPFINVLILFFFSFGIFGIVGVQMFAGVLRNRCVITGSNYDDSGVTRWRLAYDDKGDEILCSLFWLGRSCPATYLGEAVHCQSYGSTQNPLSNTMSFDHIGWAFMQVFTIYSGEEWTLIMYKTMDAWSYLGVFYFLVATFFGALFAVNLGLAVINDKFNHVSHERANGSDTASISTRIINVLSKRKESAWMFRKLMWFDYRSDDEDTAPIVAIRKPVQQIVDTLSPRSPRNSEKKYKTVSKFKSDPSILPDANTHSSSDDDYVDPFVVQSLNKMHNNSTIKRTSHIDSSDNDTNPSLSTHKSTARRKKISVAARPSSSSTARSNRSRFCCLDCLYITRRIQRRIRRRVNHLVKNDWFTRFMMAVIALNTLFLAVEHYNQPSWLSTTTRIANYCFIALFTVELILKLYGLGISFFRDWFNILDFFVVGTSYLEIIFAGVSTFSVLRSFRLLRVFKLLSWRSLRKLTDTILKSFRSIFYLSIIFSLFLFIMTLIGMQTFGGRLDSMGPPVQNYNDFIHALITTFQIITKENWVYVYANLMEAQSGDTVQQLLTIFFMVATIIIGDFILLNLFLAILLQSFDRDVDSFMIKSSRSANDKKRDANKTPVQQADTHTEGESSASQSLSDHPPDMSKHDGVPPLAIRPSPARRIHRRFSEYVIDRWRQWRQKHRSDSQRRAGMVSDDANHLVSREPAAPEVDPEHSDTYSHADTLSVKSITYTESEAEVTPKRDPMPLRGRSLFIFPPTFKPRIYLRQVLVHSITETFLLGCVVISSLMLIFETPDIDPQSVLGQIVFWFGVFFATVFTVEMLLKFFVQGLFIFSWRKENRVGYFNSLWNVLDAFIVVVSITTLVLTDNRVSAIKALRALRPLRFVNRIQGLRIVVSTLFRSMTAIVNVLIVCLLVFLIAGILGVQLFGGKLYYCSTEHLQNQQDCLYPGGVNRTMDFFWDNRTSTCTMTPDFEATIIYKDNCTAPMLWRNSHWHFDHLPSALLVLFEVGTVENWPDISNAAISAVGVDMQPKQDHNIFAGLYFVLFVAIGAIFVVNLFVGVVLSSFNRIKEEEDGSLMLTEEQKSWVATQRLFLKLKLSKKLMAPKNRLRRLVFHLVTSTNFDFFITGIIVLNIIFMTLEHDRMNSTFALVLSVADQIFTGIFIVEAVLKLVGLGLVQYVSNLWNDFDLFVVVLSVVGIVTNYLGASIGVSPTILRVFRVFRIFRILRLIKTAKRIRTLLETLYYSIPSMVNVMLTVALVCFIYAVIGMNLFYYVKPTDEMDHLANFRGFFFSMLTMIRISTSEDWNGIMRDCMNTENCTGDECGNPWLAIPFFVSYIIICTFVIMNLFVAVILDSFETQMRFEDSALNSSDLTRFAEIWSEFDPKATYTIRTELLKNLLQRLGPPLGLPADCSRAELIRKLVRLDIPEHQGKIHFIETLIPLARRVYDVDLPLKERRKLEKNLVHRFKSLKKMSSTLGYNTGEYYSATFIQAAFRGKQVRKSSNGIVGLQLVRTDSGRLHFQIDRKCWRVARMREMEKVQQAEKEEEEEEAKTEVFVEPVTESSTSEIEYESGESSERTGSSREEDSEELPDEEGYLMGSSSEDAQ